MWIYGLALIRNFGYKKWLVEIWIGLEQNIIDTAINEWRNRLRACVRTKGWHFEDLL